ncbi:hypothetical protein QJS66_07430 [Kocuria rhizophila]|nr:hypothetical protein QJS66_07430 [Kocuria rhizophila]
MGAPSRLDARLTPPSKEDRAGEDPRTDPPTARRRVVNPATSTTPRSPTSTARRSCRPRCATWTPLPLGPPANLRRRRGPPTRWTSPWPRHWWPWASPTSAMMMLTSPGCPRPQTGVQPGPG